MREIDFARKRFAGDGLAEQSEGVGGFAAALGYAVDAEEVKRIGLRELPTARAADNDLEILAVRAGFNFSNIARE